VDSGWDKKLMEITQAITFRTPEQAGWYPDYPDPEVGVTPVVL